jgi:hypothetical protein
MVEVKLEALDLSCADKDIYVAVRVGTSERLSRLAAEKSYKFPKSALGEKGDRKYGKVDIFKRVGSTTIGVRHDPKVAAQEVEVPIGGDGKVSFRVTLAEAEPLAKSDQETSKHIQNAKSYVDEHNLEMVLSDAMQAVLRERPSNPRQFIAEKMTNSEGAYRRIPGDGGVPLAPAEATEEKSAEQEAPAKAAEDDPKEEGKDVGAALSGLAAASVSGEMASKLDSDKEEGKDVGAALSGLAAASVSGEMASKLDSDKEAPAAEAPAAEQPKEETKDVGAALSGLAAASVSGEVAGQLG